MSPFRAAAAAALTLLLGGCATVMGDVRPFEPLAAEDSAAIDVPPPAQPTAGSLFAGSGGMQLFGDRRASAVGDLLTIQLVERTSARTAASTAISKDSNIGMSAPIVAGRGVTIGGTPVLEVGVDATRGFDGSGNSVQSNQLFGDVTVQVVRDLGRGNLQVSGEKRVRLNQGDELIQIQGIVRAADIGRDNRITSDRVGNARIVYGGRGTLARSNAMGWFGRFFNSAAVPY